MNDIVSKILELVIVVLVVFITRYAIPWLKSNTAINENTILIDLVNAAVMYAEQTLTGGELKKSVVVEFLKKELANKGIDITDEQINALVEAAVFAMKQNKN